jgi:hypothetical protein
VTLIASFLVSGATHGRCVAGRRMDFRHGLVVGTRFPGLIAMQDRRHVLRLLLVMSRTRYSCTLSGSMILRGTRRDLMCAFVRCRCMQRHQQAAQHTPIPPRRISFISVPSPYRGKGPAVGDNRKYIAFVDTISEHNRSLAERSRMISPRLTTLSNPETYTIFNSCSSARS